MKSITFFLLLFFTSSFLSGQSVNTQKFASKKVEQWARNMTKAHGGLKKWKKSPAIQFETKLQFLFGGMPEYHERITIHPLSRATYIDFIGQANEVSATAAFDGQQAWAKGARKGIENAPPRFTAWRNFYLFNLPWVIHDDGVHLSEGSTDNLPADLKNLLPIKMTFGNDVGDTPKDYYTLLLDPNTFELKASVYNMTYASMMRGGQKSAPASILRYDIYNSVKGMKMPTDYRVFFLDGDKHIMNGKVSNWSFSKSFDTTRLAMPDGAKVDKSQPQA